MRGYEEYKQSKYDWMGSIPAHWQSLKLRQVLRTFSEKNHSELPLLSVVREKGVIVRDVENDDNHNYIPEDLSGYKMVIQGQFAMNKMKAWQGSYGVSRYTGIVSPAYFVFYINYDMNPDFFHYSIRSRAYVSFFGQASDGIRVGQWDLSLPRMKVIPFFVPPRAEQDQIVRFLDWKVSVINRLINLKKKEIAELEELKKATISKAVTQGLDLNVPMKDSGVSWIGKIPWEWEIVQLRRLSIKIKTGGTPQGVSEESFMEDGLDWYTPSDFSGETYLSMANKKLSPTGMEMVPSFPPEAVLMIGIGGTLGKVSITPSVCSCNQQINAIVCGEKLLNKYLVYYLYSVREHIYKTAKYTTLPILNQSETKSLIVPLPSYTEQETIVSYLDKQCATIDNAIEKFKKEIETLHDLKTRLISDTVTGKIDVRNIEIPEYEFVDEASDSVLDEENESTDEEQEEEA